MDDTVSCSCPEHMYRPIEVKLGGTPSHLCWCLFTYLSTLPMFDFGISNSVYSHMNQRSSPC